MIILCQMKESLPMLRQITTYWSFKAIMINLAKLYHRRILSAVFHCKYNQPSRCRADVSIARLAGTARIAEICNVIMCRHFRIGTNVPDIAFKPYLNETGKDLLLNLLC